MTASTFELGNEFPREGFVQAQLERHFHRLGFRQEKRDHIDYVGVHPDTHETWIIEAKGETSDVGLDFRTGLGQILQAMAEPSARFGFAVPRTPKFLAQCKKVPDRVRVALGLHWLLVEESGKVVVVDPLEPLPRIPA